VIRGNTFIATKQGNAEEQPDARRELYTIFGDGLFGFVAFLYR